MRIRTRPIQQTQKKDFQFVAFASILLCLFASAPPCVFVLPLASALPLATALSYHIRSLARTGLLLPTICITASTYRLRCCCYPPFALLLLPAGCVDTAATDNHTAAAREPHRFSKITQIGRMIFKISKKESDLIRNQNESSKKE